MKPSYERLENNLKELQSAYNKQCVVLNWKRNFIDSINEALGITPNSQEVTGENALDAIADLKKQIASAEKKAWNEAIEEAVKKCEKWDIPRLAESINKLKKG